MDSFHPHFNVFQLAGGALSKRSVVWNCVHESFNCFQSFWCVYWI